MKRSTLIKSILGYLAVGGIIITAPGAIIPLGVLVKMLAEAQTYSPPPRIPEEADPDKVRKSIYYLRRNKYIKIRQVSKTKFSFDLTEKGKKLLGKYNFENFQIISSGVWDGRWRMFAFDIPEKKRAIRDMLRDKLKRLGFFQFQKSVWIFPFDCAEEIEYVCEFLEIKANALMFTGEIYNDTLLRKYFLREGILSKADFKI